MSAIAGWVDFDGGIEPDRRRARAESALGSVIADAAATWNDRHCTLIARRLNIDAGDEAHPLLSDAGEGIRVAIDGYIFNQPELASALALPATCSPTTLVAAAWQTWGDTFAARLNGEFALAAWNPTARRLLLVADHLATVPLYFCDQVGSAGRGLAFGTEMGALLAAAARRGEVDWEHVADYFARRHQDSDRTFLAGVRVLRRGTTLLATTNDLNTTQYWTFPPPPAGRVRDLEEGVDRFRAALHRAVIRRMGAGPAVGSHLTGGLDSSAVAAVAARACRAASDASRLHLFSIVPWLPGETGDLVHGTGDLEAIPAFLRTYPETNHTYFAGHAEAPWQGEGVPNGPTSLHLTDAAHDVTLAALAAGCRVMLTGFGGELGATFAGEGAHQAAFRHGHCAG